MKHEPLRILAAVRAVIMLLVTLGLVQFTDADVETILASVGAIYAALEVVLTELQRRRVTPVSKATQNVREAMLAAGASEGLAATAEITVRDGEIPEWLGVK